VRASDLHGLVAAGSVRRRNHRIVVTTSLPLTQRRRTTAIFAKVEWRIVMSRYHGSVFSSGKGIGPFAAILWALMDRVEDVSVELRGYGGRRRL